MAKPKRAGRKRGSRNRGFFYRQNRGWQTKDRQGNFVWLTDESGARLRDPNASEAAKVAYARWIVAEKQKPAPVEAGPCATVEQVCVAYLDKAKEQRGENKTFRDRAETLFDFVYGLPPRFKTNPGKATKSDKIHDGYGARPACELKPIDVDRWLQAHEMDRLQAYAKKRLQAHPREPLQKKEIKRLQAIVDGTFRCGWKGGKRSRIQAVKRAMNYGVEAGLIPVNPIHGYKTEKVVGRVTYITPEQEAALLEHAKPAPSMAIRVLIRSGMRPGCEFAAMTARHVKDDGQRIEIEFQPHESKTKRVRMIRVTDPAILAIIRKQIALYPSGPIFRQSNGKGWAQKNLSLSFRRLKGKLVGLGLEFDADCCLYSLRHTYAKRCLQGYWTGKATNIETLARLMGNSPQVCRDHYLQCTETYNEPLWEAC